MAFLALVFLVVFIIGIVALVKGGIEKLRIPNRKTATIVTIVSFVLFAAFAGASGDSEEADGNDNDEAEEALAGSENEENNNENGIEENNNNEASENEFREEPFDLSSVQESVEGNLESDRDIGDEFYLLEIDYDSDTNILSARYDMQIDPIPSAEYIVDSADAYTWFKVEAIPELADMDYNVRSTVVTSIGDDEYILWGHAIYDHETDEYRFEEESGMQLFE